MKIGVLGGGQLARMLALAGYPLGLELFPFVLRRTPAPHHWANISVPTSIMKPHYTAWPGKWTGSPTNSKACLPGRWTS